MELAECICTLEKGLIKRFDKRLKALRHLKEM
jgi:hypothetical protein